MRRRTAFPSREQVLSYLQDYASALHLSPRLNEEVREARSARVAPGPGGFGVRCSEVRLLRWPTIVG